MVNASVTNWISENARQLGFAMCGVVRAEKFPELARNDEWLARGYAGEMNYLNDARRGDPLSAMAGIRSVIVCALTYNTQHSRSTQDWATGGQEPRGWISRYAWGDDYHEVLRAKLETLLGGLREQCTELFAARVYSDTGPINERVLARHAGLGWLGKNTLLLNERWGSFFFLGTILTTLDLQPTWGRAEPPPADRCGSCRRCIDACPTEALVEPYVMDARKCISYLTIELRGAIPEELREPMGQHIFGCDICQDVCPWNRNAPVTQTKEFQPRIYNRVFSEMCFMESDAQEPHEGNHGLLETPGGDEVQDSLVAPRLEWLASVNEEDFRAMFRGSPIKRAKWKALIRNVCIALGNSKIEQDSATHERVSKLLSQLAAGDESLISESAQWAISRIQANDKENGKLHHHG
jgi:epoxyqueuosine reductase